MERITSDLMLSPLQPKDHGQLFILMKQIYPPVYKHLWYDGGVAYVDSLYSKINFEKEVSDPLSKYYFIFYMGMPVGILRILINERPPGISSPDCIKLQRIYLAPSVQGKGIGKKLIQWAEKEFSHDKETTLWLETMSTQKAAVSFYEKTGFKIIGHFTFDSESMKGQYREMVIMAKNIAKE